MFQKIETTLAVEAYVQMQVDKWKEGKIHGRDLTNSIVTAIETDCDMRFAALKTVEGPQPAPNQLKEAIALLNRWMDDPDQDLLLSDTDKFIRGATAPD